MLWIVTQIFEMNGARAASLEGRDFKQNLIESLKGIFVVRTEINPRFVLFVKAVVGVSIVLMIVYRKNKPLADEKLWMIVAAFVANTVYLILLCAKAGSSYITRVGVFFGIAFWELLLLVYLMNYCCVNMSWMIQVVDADRAGDESMKLFVPWFDHPDNFPIATYGGERITNTLYVHGIVSRFIKVDEVVPTKDFKALSLFGYETSRYDHLITYDGLPTKK